MDALSVSCSTALLRVDIAPPRLACFPGAAEVARRLLLRAAGVVLPRLQLQVDLVLLAELLVAVRVLGPGVYLTAPHKFCASCDNPLIGDWHPTSLFQGS